MFNKIAVVILLLLISGVAGYFISDSLQVNFEDLSAVEKYERIIQERDIAISEAKTAGDFRCCINPPCTMCFMEANEWNNFTPGTCACDDLIAQGKEPCPQCKRGLADGTCSSVVNPDEECDVDLNFRPEPVD
ncbi:hypothetical protein HQ544_04710 [Candidatus Falkowbacteria bacterium]|nr:hypothetical protein [Candidatus Falkowbacteria bacterium]